MNVTEQQLERWRNYATEPEREPMGHMIGGPSAQGRFIAQAQEMARMRIVIGEMLAVIEMDLNERRNLAWEESERE